MPVITKREAIRRGVKSGAVHTIIAPKHFDLRATQQWLKQHGFKAGVRGALDTYRFSQGAQIEGARFYSKTLPNGLVFVFQRF